MRVGILGSGLMGAKLGTIFARAGHDVVFSYQKQQNKIEEVASSRSVFRPAVSSCDDRMIP